MVHASPLTGHSCVLQLTKAWSAPASSCQQVHRQLSCQQRLLLSIDSSGLPGKACPHTIALGSDQDMSPTSRKKRACCSALWPTTIFTATS